MKKIFTLCIIALILTLTSVNADEIELGTWNEVDSATCSVFMHMNSTYSIMIPSVITADGSWQSISAGSLDLCPGDEVIVRVHGIDNNKVILNTENGKVMEAYMYLSNGSDGPVTDGSVIAKFTDEDRSGNSFMVYWQSSQGAGNYYGNLTFDVSLNEEMLIW